MLVLGGFGVRHNFYVFSLYLDLNNQIFDCLLTSIWLPCRVRTCGHLSCLWVIWHKEWLGSTTTNRHGVAAFYFVIVSGCTYSVWKKTKENMEEKYAGEVEQVSTVHGAGER